MTLKASPLNNPRYTLVHLGFSCVGMCTLNGCPSTLLFISCCWGTSSRCTYLLGGAGGIRSAQTPRLLSGDAFSVFSAIRMVRARLAKVCVSEVCENRQISLCSRYAQCNGIMSYVETFHWGISQSNTYFEILHYRRRPNGTSLRSVQRANKRLIKVIRF